MTPNKPVIGVTGNSGAGKGAVCGILSRMGGFCVDADKLSHQVMEQGGPAYTEITDMFGPGVLAPDKSIDRRALGDIVFRDPGKRRELERIVHAEVAAECRLLTEMARGMAEYGFIVWDAPLLAEAGMHKQCVLVLLVTAPYAVKLARIQARDGITEERAKLRLSNQPPETGLYQRLAGDLGKGRVAIIENNGDYCDLTAKTISALRDCRVIGCSSR